MNQRNECHKGSSLPHDRVKKIPEHVIMKKESAPNFVKMEEDILAFWKQNESFETLKVQNKKKNEEKTKKGEKPRYFSFLDGPVTANYKMGLHHAWNRTLKDIMLRYHAMQGCEAHYQNGFDSHGLPVELRVEKELGLDSKKDIETFGMQNFIEKCMETVDYYAGLMTESSVRLGQWMNWDDSYFTNSDENITSIWHFLKKCHEKGWLVEKYRPTPWCTRCGTALSEHEMSDADAYKEVEHTAVFFKCPIQKSDAYNQLLEKNGQSEKTQSCLVVWTTTPWTLSANVAVAVNPELTYCFCRSKSDDRLLVIGKDALKIAKGDLAEVVFETKGSELAGFEFETCFPEISEQKFAHKVVLWEDVGATEGSGMVHIAPGCGAEDFELGEKLGLPKIVPIDEAGNFGEGFSFYTGKNANKVAEEVFEELKKRNKLFYTHKYKHRYPHCWRCKNPLVFRLVKDWVIRMDEIRPALIEAIEEVEFQPEFMKKRMLDWLINMGDWSISRKRYYGVPLPFYVCPDCGKITVVGSLDELKEKAVTPFTYGKNGSLPHLHKPYIDNVQIQCPDCGTTVSRIAEVGDCWLDAGITPFSTKKYFTDKKFWEQNFVSDVVLEGREQIRLWFYSLLVMAVTLEKRPPYKKIICTAMLLDKDGQKLSKSSPNNIPLQDAFNLFGADAIRYLFASNNMLADVRFSKESADEIRRKLLAFWNTYIFFNTYASIDKVDEEFVDGKENPLFIGKRIDKSTFDKTDIWLMQKTNNFIKNSKKWYENQQFSAICEEFERFADDLSNWYVRINRKRFWGDADLKARKAAYRALYIALKSIITVMAPTTPFMCEHIWQSMVRPVEKEECDSVFLADFPSAHMVELMQEKNAKNLLVQTEVAREIISLGGRLRSENNLKVKQPLSKMFLIVSGEEEVAAKTFADVIQDELNIKEIVFETDPQKFNTAVLSLDFRKAGAVLKGEAQTLKNVLSGMSAQEMASVVDKVREGGTFSVQNFNNLTADLFVLSYKPKEGFVIVTENDKTVVLDTHITEELKNQGLLRELIHSIQNMRKEANFNIEQRVALTIFTDHEAFSNFLKQSADEISSSTLATSLVFTQKSFSDGIVAEGKEICQKLSLSDGFSVLVKVVGQ